MRVRGTQVDVYDATKPLDVSALLIGSLRVSGSRFRVLAQLADMATGIYLWSETYDRTVQDVPEIQDEMAAAIARSLEMPLTGVRLSSARGARFRACLEGIFGSYTPTLG